MKKGSSVKRKTTDKQRLWLWGRVYPKPERDVWDDSKFKNRSVEEHSDRLTEFSRQELAQLDLAGIPIKVNHIGTHENKLGAEVIGRVVSNRSASDGSLFILGYIDTGRGGNHHDYRTVGNIVRDEIRTGRLRGLSLGYSHTGVEEYLETKKVERQVLEVSVVKEPARTNCYIDAFVDDIEAEGHESHLQELDKVFDLQNSSASLHVDKTRSTMNVENVLSILDKIKRVILFF